MIQQREYATVADLPVIATAAALRQVLNAELGYCTCACADAVPFLRDVLLLVKARSEATTDWETFVRASHALDIRLQLDTASVLANWFVYMLDRANFVHHNYNVSDLWITDKGRALLDALERFPDPALLEDASDGSDDP
jgi:hypothetical protein